MYKSVSRWVNMEITIRPFLKNDKYGQKTFGTSYNANCSKYDDIKVITNFNGREVISNSQLYMDGTISINVLDDIMIGNTEYAIQHIATYYENKVPSLKVVYL